tara:strand:+ start:485 stop:1168 length:684 start_codon:yes stop_codon:yes gene_type:complete
MRRADRLFRIVEFLKARRFAVKAVDLASELEVSTRTIYRDMADLQISGVPITGEAGVGYMLSSDHVVKPLMFNAEEVDALMLGVQMVKSWGDKALAKSAGQAIDKITSTLPESLRQEIENTFLFSKTSEAELPLQIDFTTLRRAIRSKNKLQMTYTELKGESSERCIRPLCLIFFSPVWLLLGWCEKRHDFRSFRLDRISQIQVLDLKYIDEAGKRLSDYQRQNGYT